MSDEIAVVLDAGALRAYVSGRVAVGELIAEVADERRHVGVPTTCLAAANASAADDVEAALLDLLVTTPVVRILPLTAADARDVGTLARRGAGDVTVGHAAHAALTHRAHYATTDPVRAAEILPNKWSILDLDQF